MKREVIHLKDTYYKNCTTVCGIFSSNSSFKFVSDLKKVTCQDCLRIWQLRRFNLKLAKEIENELTKEKIVKQTGIIYPENCGFPEGKICLNCAEYWEEHNLDKYDVDSGKSTTVVYGPFLCSYCNDFIYAFPGIT